MPSTLQATPHGPVLLVEDDSEIRYAFALLLQLAGFTVEEAQNGRVALQKLQAGLLPCIIVLDLMMPVMDGREFRQHQLRDPQIADVPVVVCSAVQDIDTLSADMGAVEILRKPVDFQRLVSLITRHC